MTESVESLAALVDGTICGDAARLIDDAAAIESANPSAVTFVADMKNVSRLKDCQAGAVLMPAKVAAMIDDSVSFARIIVADAQVAFLKILPLFRKIRSRPERGISPHAHIHETASIGPNCHVAAGVWIGEDVVIGADCDLLPGVVIGAGSRIGDQVVLHPNVVIYHDVTIGNRVIIHSGAVIGADGFGYRFAAGRFEKIPQLGSVQIQDDVEIGACTTVDRGAIGPTIIGEGTKLDNLVMIGHNCEVGRHNVFASQVGLAGSCQSGDYVRLGGQVGVRDHAKMNTGATVGAKAGVLKDVPAGETWLGIPATHEMEQKRLVVAMRRLPDMKDQLRDLEKQVAALAAELQKLKGNPPATDPVTHRAAG
ncbi:UDP-3-O-(3-hydroxymyristoyl)glucosamine N-acyltransferase [Schlesneria sp. T3-172]|uniref:UDP-3-O-(3-hydroxymyristoyl)glucosamine N-acyltransferase n=1 Tax=Schlesneria TaxID=656899 RepID=UPI002F1E71A8